MICCIALDSDLSIIILHASHPKHAMAGGIEICTSSSNNYYSVHDAPSNCKYSCIKFVPTQLCKSTKVVDTANSTVQKYKGRNLNCAILQGYWITANSTVQKYKGCGAANLTVQKYKGPGC